MTGVERKPTIVIVDDEAPIRSAMTRFFERRGWRCLQAADGAEAAAILFRETPEQIDVVLCDVRLPDTTGVELFQRAAAEFPNVAGRFVLATGDGDGVNVSCPVLAKPFPLAELASVADRILQQGRAA